MLSLHVTSAYHYILTLYIKHFISWIGPTQSHLADKQKKNTPLRWFSLHGNTRHRADIQERLLCESAFDFAWSAQIQHSTIFCYCKPPWMWQVMMLAFLWIYRADTFWNIGWFHNRLVFLLLCCFLYQQKKELFISNFLTSELTSLAFSLY